MNNLYDYLFSQEIRRADAESGRLRCLVIGVVLTAFLITGHGTGIVLCVLFLIMNLLILLRKGTGGRVLSPYLLVFLETGLISGGLFYAAPLNLTLLYLIVLYSASLRLNDRLILFAGALVLFSMNSLYMAELFISGTLLENPVHWPGFVNQLILTLIILFFTLTLLSRPHTIKGLLNNQQIFLDSVSNENHSLFDSLDDFCLDHSLSEREKDVLKILITGKTYRMIGTDLFISLDTVKSHVRSLYRKTGAGGKSDLIMKLRNFTLARMTHSD